MFLFHIALSLDLIALAAGAALISRTKQAEGCCSTLAKIIGYIVAILALISLVCTIASGVRHWQHGWQFGYMSTMEQTMSSAPAGNTPTPAPQRP